MAATFVQSLFQGAKGATTGNFVLSGSKVIVAGDTIFVGLTSPSTLAKTLSDNLGNTYSLVFSKSSSLTGNAYLYRADVTNAGTLTSITVNSSGFTGFAGIAVEFSGVGALRGSPTFSVIDSNQYNASNAVPGDVIANTTAYQAGDLWLGVFNLVVAATFATDTGSNAVAAVEPTPEQSVAANAIGLLYYLSPSALPAARLAGRWSSSNYAIAIGFVFQSVPTGIINNDVVAGAIVFTEGLVAERKTVSDTPPPGSLALGGTSIDHFGHGFSDAPAGALLLSGVAAAPSRGYIDARTGALVLSGTCVSAHRRGYTDAPSGSLGLNGTVVDSWTRRTVYSDAPAGAIGIIGTRTESWRFNDKPTGRLVFGGPLVDGAIFRQVVTGSFKAYGWAAETLPNGTPRPVGIPGDVDMSAFTVVDPTILRPSMCSGYAIGDLLLCFVVAGANANLVEASPGWTIGSMPVDTSRDFYLVGKVAATTEEASPTLTMSTSPAPGTPVSARMVAFRGLATGSGVVGILDAIGEVKTINGTFNQMSGGAAFVTAHDNDLVLSMGERYGNVSATVVIPPPGFSMLTWSNVPSGQQMTVAWAYQAQRQAGAVPDQVFSVGTGGNNTTRATYGLLVALKGVTITANTDAPAGTLALAGSLVERWGKNDKQQGVITLTGSAVDEHRLPRIYGTLPLSGTVQESWSITAALTATLALTGTALTRQQYIDAASGAIDINGTVDEQRVISDVCAGVLKLIGVVSESLILSVSPHGTVRLTGRSSEFGTIDDKIFYDDFPGGLLEIRGKTIVVNDAVTPGRPGRIVGGLQVARIVKHLEPGRVVGNLTGRLTP